MTGSRDEILQHSREGRRATTQRCHVGTYEAVHFGRYLVEIDIVS